jgi:hypothetical protein
MSFPAALVRVLADGGPLEFDRLVIRFPGYIWNQLFSMVDHLSQTGVLSVFRPTRSSFVVKCCGHPMRAGRAQS